MKDIVTPSAIPSSNKFIKCYHLHFIPGQTHLCATSHKALGTVVAMNSMKLFQEQFLLLRSTDTDSVRKGITLSLIQCLLKWMWNLTVFIPSSVSLSETDSLSPDMMQRVVEVILSCFGKAKFLGELWQSFIHILYKRMEKPMPLRKNKKSNPKPSKTKPGESTLLSVCSEIPTR